ncbi:MAG TPA: ABC transporter ATP-binding protein [Candidatus Aquilonibacter sp.]|nr:ABC transporter ATP-binding protein [Candidatus Aquilonibacter sp.]
MTDSPAIEARGLTKRYGSFVALDHVSFAVPRGQILGYLGPNGAGKSTTIGILVGMLSASEGSVFFGGHEFRRDDYAMRRRLGYVPESGGLYETMTGFEFLQMTARLYHLGEKEAERKARGFLELFELERAMHQRMGTYSKGMRQRVLISAALLHDPELLFFDEPLTGLDANTALLLKDLVRQLAQDGKTIFYCSHVLEVVERLCDRVIILDKGKAVADGSMAELRSSTDAATLEQIFQQLTHEEDTEARVRQFQSLLRSEP